MLEFQKQQQQFADYVRYGKNIINSRIQVYRDNFLAGMDEILASCFSRLHANLDACKWQELVQNFYAQHHSTTPLFHEITTEFLGYLIQERQARDDDPPYLLELAHFEWLVLQVYYGGSGEQVTGYHHTVHQDMIIKQPTVLRIYRGEDDDVYYQEIKTQNTYNTTSPQST
jgi:hypothetical protein